MNLYSFLASIDPVPQGVWPVTVIGWITPLLASLTIGFLLYDRIAGKTKSVLHMESKIDLLSGEVEDLKGTQLVLSNNVLTLNETILRLTFELKGVDGQNGAKGDIREIRAELAQIQARNRKMDILASSVQAMMDIYDGPERREHLRRLKVGRRVGEDEE